MKQKQNIHKQVPYGQVFPTQMQIFLSEWSL